MMPEEDKEDFSNVRILYPDEFILESQKQSAAIASALEKLELIIKKDEPKLEQLGIIRRPPSHDA